MTKGLLNYTTSISVEKTIAEIQSKLAKAGAQMIVAEYEEGLPVSLSFAFQTFDVTRAYRLPADPVPVKKVLDDQYWSGKIPKKFATYEQAQRVAWRIVKDWIEAQIALIQTEMVTLDQVMLPYMIGVGNKTVYQLYRERKLLPALEAGPALDEDEIEDAEVVG